MIWKGQKYNTAKTLESELQGVHSNENSNISKE